MNPIKDTSEIRYISEIRKFNSQTSLLSSTMTDPSLYSIDCSLCYLCNGVAQIIYHSKNGQ